METITVHWYVPVMVISVPTPRFCHNIIYQASLHTSLRTVLSMQSSVPLNKGSSPGFDNGAV